MKTVKGKTLFKRQKLLLAFLQEFGGRLSKTDFQEYLFLFTQWEEKQSYEFVPYKYGCFSFQSYADKRKLIELGILANENDWQLTSLESDYSSDIEFATQEKISSFVEKFSNLKGDELIRYVYKNYPYFAINSCIANKIMEKKDLEKIDTFQPKDETFCFFTIGYEGKSFENYLNRLIKNNIKTLCDVRKNLLSRKYGFSKTQLSKIVNALGIEYKHIPELGIVSEKRQELKTQKDYERLFQDYNNTTLKDNHLAIEKLYQLFLDKKRIAITCFEENVSTCHRGQIALALSKLSQWKFNIKHI
ncbi:DUF488 domain-containing protein [Bartonella sp. WD16.2]|uniref:DUF488 domain-containing protein n=1 Tax=Bartonella sp. WD16.2 TaxID=1933904 RepID=UPI00099953DB|nr:DUF488 domain-containing protein [Bartonella sp. WD16.2]AQX20218.1 putative hypothetical protein, DUF488 family [Bartonella sp. WD16.2]